MARFLIQKAISNLILLKKKKIRKEKNELIYFWIAKHYDIVYQKNLSKIKNNSLKFWTQVVANVR